MNFTINTSIIVLLGLIASSALYLANYFFFNYLKSIKNKIYLLVSVLLLGNIFVLHAQITFSKVFYDSLQSGIEARSAILLDDNGFVIVGKASYQKGLIMRMDSLGSIVWSKQIETLNNSGNIDFDDIIATKDSCFVIVGSVVASGNTLACCLKINRNGDTLWTRAIGINGFSISSASVQQTFDSGYILAGNVMYPTTKIFIAKLDSMGSYEWGITLTGGNNNICSSIKQTPDSGYVLTGYIENYPPYNPNAFIAKLSPEGSLTWAKKYNNTEDLCFGKDILIENNSFLCYFITGYKRTILKVDFEGDILWKKSYGEFSGNSVLSYSHLGLNKMYDGNYIFVNSSVDCSGDGTIIKIDSLGNIVWSHALFLSAFAAIESKDKGIVIAGNGPLCGVKTPTILIPQIGIIKTDSVGNGQNCVSGYDVSIVTYNLTDSIASFTSQQGMQEAIINFQFSSIPLVSYSGCVDFSGGIHEPDSHNEIFLSPNPSNGFFKINFSEKRHCKLSIYNNLSDRVYQSEVYTQQSEIDLTAQPKGLYFYQAIFSDNEYSTGRLIIE